MTPVEFVVGSQSLRSGMTNLGSYQLFYYFSNQGLFILHPSFVDERPRVITFFFNRQKHAKQWKSRHIAGSVYLTAKTNSILVCLLYLSTDLDSTIELQSLQ